PLVLGCDIENGVLSFFFPGRVDEATLYNRALSAAEVAAIYAADVAGKSASQPCFTSPAIFPDAVPGSGYTQQMTTVLGTLPVSFSVSAGSLPAGLTLSSAGLVSGVPTIPGSNVFGVLGTDAVGAATELVCGLRVLQPATPAGLVAWWRGENNALDSVGTNNG